MTVLRLLLCKVDPEACLVWLLFISLAMLYGCSPMQPRLQTELPPLPAEIQRQPLPYPNPPLPDTSPTLQPPTGTPTASGKPA